jgi:hypothetical protein
MRRDAQVTDRGRPITAWHAICIASPGPPKETHMTTKLLAAALIAALPLAGVAADDKAPATPAGQSGSFDTLDANKDGRISMPEASADPKLVETFATADKNGDGYLDNSEFDDRTRENSR